MAYAVAYAQVVIPASFSRLKQQGYATTILMSDIWPFTVPQTQENIANDSTDQPANNIPVILLSRIIDEPGVSQGT
jgi:hypothetical protein